jgi:adenine-specific DNA-methyltransferase
MTDMTLPPATDDAAGSGDVAAENLTRLKALFPQIVRDGAIDVEVLRQLVGEAVETGEERYGLNWKGKAAARAHALTPSLGTLRPAKADSVDWDTTQNIMIEGDNLEALKLLRRSYAGKIKLIYIDPPYNTGADFVYPDDYSEPIAQYERLTEQRNEAGLNLFTNKESSGRFHTAWLNMIYPRLLLAKDFLRDDGVILVSTGAEELNHLIDLLQEIFDDSNFIEAISRVMKSGGAKGTYFTPNIDYILVFARSKSDLEPFRIEINSNQIDSYYNKIQTDGERAGERYGEERLYLPSLDIRPNQRYYIEAPDGTFLIPPGSTWPADVGDGKKITPQPGDGCWRWTYETYAEAKRQGRIIFKETETTSLLTSDRKAAKFNIYFKLWLKDQQEKGKVPANMLTGIENRKSSAELHALGIPFDYAKPSDLIKHLLTLTGARGDDIILDFFAGSGTTGHAVMAQNATDSANRRYILVQLPEPLDPAKSEQKTAADFCDTIGRPRNIAELTKERLRRAGAKLKAEHPSKDFDAGFRVYKLATSNLRPWQPAGDDLAGSLLDAVDNVLPDRSEDDLLVELMLKTGIDLAMPSKTRTIAGQTVHAFGGGALMVCLGTIADAKAEELALGIAAWRTELAPAGQTAFWFKDSGFASAAAKANVAAILRQRIAASDIARIAAL